MDEEKSSSGKSSETSEDKEKGEESLGRQAAHPECPPQCPLDGTGAGGVEGMMDLDGEGEMLFIEHQEDFMEQKKVLCFFLQTATEVKLENSSRSRIRKK